MLDAFRHTSDVTRASVTQHVAWLLEDIERALSSERLLAAQTPIDEIALATLRKEREALHAVIAHYRALGLFEQR